MEEIDKYSRLTQTEFLEFIARLGYLLFADRTHLTVLEKIELVLTELFKPINEKVKNPPRTEDDELVSDFEDDIVQVARKKMREANHEQFLIVDITKPEVLEIINNTGMQSP